MPASTSTTSRTGGRKATGATADTTHQRVFVVDDHELVREGLRFLLDTSDTLCYAGEAATVADAIARAPAVKPDLALIDVQLPDGSGIEVCREIRAMLPETRCVMLTSFADDEAMMEAVMAGAAGFILKQARSRELLQAIEKVADGSVLLDPAAVERQRQLMHRAARSDDHRLEALTDQERRILELVADGLTNTEIASELSIAPKTAKNSISSILLKLGMTRRVNAAVFAVRNGLR
jgi:DNA-binding NarL/FixJ family response regulator